ncbi:hypothetical protein HXX76_002953 [Chlamydomonas incerta]|uniref:SAM-dependent MTase RsmB/NOP-type domain-containing protein n=1 Tax=Chlamydomonas incerta TaxID=51695 RepID=A0A835W9C2_CHLIN|nr:hypothetical protein HXX76_002953 [Chlamydomonas incerta]|eukprot:KAG2442874.1 hypothetical protein HXX76_002953 [Chlamydomonas incerta]
MPPATKQVMAPRQASGRRDADDGRRYSDRGRDDFQGRNEYRSRDDGGRNEYRGRDDFQGRNEYRSRDEGRRDDRDRDDGGRRDDRDRDDGGRNEYRSREDGGRDEYRGRDDRGGDRRRFGGGRGGRGGRFGRGGRGGRDGGDRRRSFGGGERRERDDRERGGDDRPRFRQQPEEEGEYIDPRILKSPRYLALKQLMRIEEGGAYSGLVNGSPAEFGPPQRRRGPRGATRLDEEDDELEAAVAVRADDEGKPLDPRDQRLIKELVSGCTRLQRRLDYVVSRLSNQTPADFQAGVRLVLRLGVFELMERQLPPHALNEHVQLAKALVRPGVGSFVNGVLRSAGRHMDAGTLPTPENEPSTTADAKGGGALAKQVLRRLAIQHSHPTWMAARWVARFGEEAAAELMSRNNTPPVYTVRVNTLHRGDGGCDPATVLEQLTEAGVTAVASPYLPAEFIRVERGLQRLLADGFVRRGQLHVQDESAGLVVALLDPQPGERLLDCCAAPGGKTLFAAARMRGNGSITALDVSAARLRALRRAADAAGVGSMVTVQAADLREWSRQQLDREAWVAEFAGGEPQDAAWSRAGPKGQPQEGGPEALRLYDKLLLDAPCTGTGVLSKRADLRWRRTPEQLEELVELQDELLDAAAPLVRVGGILVYSTCSMEAEEDEERVRAFLARHPEYVLEHAASVRQGAAAETDGGRKARRGGGSEPGVPAEVVSEEGFVATLPHVHGTDGAFAARMRRVK